MLTCETIPSIMKAILLSGYGGFDKMRYADTETPQLQGNEVLVRVKACGLNNTDINTRVGWYSKSVSGATDDAQIASTNEDGAWGGSTLDFPHIQGADVCGIVVAVMRESERYLLGKRVLIDTWLRNWDVPMDRWQCRYFGSECKGGFAEYTKAPSQQIHLIESDYTDCELATFPTAYATAENMLARANVKAGQVVLITGASGGVGSALIQLAKRRGTITVALCSEAKQAMLRDAVAPDVILPRNLNFDDLTQKLRDAIGREKVDVVADIVGGDYFSTLLEVIDRGGYYTCSGAIAGPIVSLDLRSFYLNDITFTGATVTTPNIFGDIVSYIERKQIKPLLAETHMLQDLQQAQEAFLAKQHLGNIVVKCSNDAS